jgi:hypothetical protein
LLVPVKIHKMECVEAKTTSATAVSEYELWKRIAQATTGTYEVNEAKESLKTAKNEVEDELKNIFGDLADLRVFYVLAKY